MQKINLGNWVKNLIALSLIVAMFVFTYFTVSHNISEGDSPFHIARLIELRYDIASSQYPMIISKYGALQGNAVMAFYPWLTLLPLVPLTYLPFGYLNNFIIICFVILALQWCCSYLSSRVYFHSNTKGFLFSSFYLVAMFWYLIDAHDIGASLAISFVPLSFFGFLSLLKHGRWKILAIGMILIIYSHVVTCFLILIVMILIGLLNLKQLTKRWLPLLKAISVTCISTILYWLPILYLLVTNHIHFPSGTAGFFNHPKGMFIATMTVVVAISTLLIPLRCRLSYLNKTVYVIIIFFILTQLKWSQVYIFKSLPFLKIVQFNSRYLLIIALLGAYLMASLITPRVLLGLLICSSLVFLPLDSIKSFIQPQVIHAYTQRTLLNDTKGKEKPLIATKKAFREQEHDVMESPGEDYTPTNAYHRIHLEYFPIHPRRLINQLPYHILVTNRGTIIILNHRTRNIRVPVVVYHGLSYCFYNNGRAIKKNQYHIEHHILVINRLDKGQHDIRLRLIGLGH